MTRVQLQVEAFLGLDAFVEIFRADLDVLKLTITSGRS